MRRCRHKRSRESISLIPQPNGHARSVETRWCFDCESRIGLGPSSDESESVQIEIRAAEIAASHGAAAAQGLFRDGATADWFGWCQHYAAVVDPQYSAAVTCHEYELAGWLAREIATHEEPT